MGKSSKIGGLQRFEIWQREQSLKFSVVMLDAAATTSQLAADALGCQVGEIAKSLVFRQQSSDQAVL
eukprot:UN20867